MIMFYLLLVFFTSFLATNGEGICSCTCKNTPFHASDEKQPSSRYAKVNNRPGLIIESPKITNWGVWGNWEICPIGTYAIGFGTKVPISDEVGKDKLGLVGIRLHCAKPGSTRIDYKKVDRFTVSSTHDHGFEYRDYRLYTSWDHHHRCHEGLLIGFNLRVQPEMDNDEVAATNIKFICSNPKIGELEGIVRVDRGGYAKTDQKCAPLQAICGIRTQVEITKNRYDNTGLNNVQIFCCDMPDPAEECKPTDDWMNVISCENLGSDHDISCLYEYSQGISHTISNSKSGFEEWEATSSAGFTVEHAFKFIESSFGAKLAKSAKTGVEWSKESSETYSTSRRTVVSFPVPPGEKFQLSQAEGKCGDFTIGSSKFKLTTYDRKDFKLSERSFNPNRTEFSTVISLN